MLDLAGTLACDTGNGGRATERSSMARPRYQDGSLVVRGKKRKRYVLRWREDVARPDRTIDRIQRAETIGFVSQMKRHEALEVLQSRVSSIGQQRRQPKVTMTLSEFVRTEWNPNAALTLKKSSMRIYGFQLERHIFPALGSMPLRVMNRAQIETCLSNMKQKGHATSTLRNIRATFSTVLQAAVDHGFLEKNPAHRIRIREADTKKERRFYSSAEMRKLLAVLPEPCRSVVSVAVLAGMRIGEILALRWKRIDLLRGTIEVAENYSCGEFVTPKTKSSRWVLPISSTLVDVLKKYRANGGECSPEALVFRTSKGTPLNAKNLYNRELAPACDQIELPRVSWHSFRHTHATLLGDVGGSLKTAQALLGHSDMETTLNTYTHAVPDSQRTAVERVAGVLFSDVLNSVSGQFPDGRVN
jgi:integrase